MALSSAEYSARHRARYGSAAVVDDARQFFRNAEAKARRLGRFSEPMSRLAILEMDDGLCGICGEDVDPAVFETDHIIPFAQGGWNGYDNVQLAHRTCNRVKGRN